MYPKVFFVPGRSGRSRYVTTNSFCGIESGDNLTSSPTLRIETVCLTCHLEVVRENCLFFFFPRKYSVCPLLLERRWQAVPLPLCLSPPFSLVLHFELSISLSGNSLRRYNRYLLSAFVLPPVRVWNPRWPEDLGIRGTCLNYLGVELSVQCGFPGKNVRLWSLEDYVGADKFNALSSGSPLRFWRWWRSISARVILNQKPRPTSERLPNHGLLLGSIQNFPGEVCPRQFSRSPYNRAGRYRL